MLDKLTQLHKSKFVKCFLIAIVLVFSYEVSKPKAFVPLAWAGAVLAGMAAEQLITMGVKAVSKQVLKKKADDYAQQALDSGAKFDFMGTNPYRNKDGSITLSPSANDRAKMAGLISGAMLGSLAIGGEACSPSDPDMVDKIFYQDNPDMSFFYMTKYYDEQKDHPVFQWNNAYTGTKYTQVKLPLAGLKITYLNAGKSGTIVNASYVLNGSRHNLSPIMLDYIEAPVYSQSVSNAHSVGEDINECGGMFFPSSAERVYDVPLDSNVELPNEERLTGIDIVINNVMPSSDKEGEITWNDIEQHYNDTGQSFDDVINNHIDQKINNGLIAENVITVGEINNIYTDTGLTPKKDDFKPVPKLPVVPGDNLPAEPVDQLDHSMWQVMRNTYNYLDDGIDSSLAAMKGITDSASGVTNYLGQTMGWLPAEWRAVFTSAFVLGVFAHFLRR